MVTDGAPVGVPPDHHAVGGDDGIKVSVAVQARTKCDTTVPQEYQQTKDGCALCRPRGQAAEERVMLGKFSVHKGGGLGLCVALHSPATVAEQCTGWFTGTPGVRGAADKVDGSWDGGGDEVRIMGEHGVGVHPQVMCRVCKQGCAVAQGCDALSDGWQWAGDGEKGVCQELQAEDSCKGDEQVSAGTSPTSVWREQAV